MDAPQNSEITARRIMLEFAGRTGLAPAGPQPQRYLWTDAFAVCNFLGLYRQTGDEQYLDLARRLVDQVHTVLGRHRPDDSRRGWISGLGDEEGKRHPTKGGLRIGKEMAERGPDEPFDERMEWDRDGQYFHYLTQWMHTLDCFSRTTGDPTYNRWARELAVTAHSRFAYSPQKAGKRLYWKMSIDLSHPLVSSMGHHDPLDGLVTYCELRTTEEKLSGRSGSPTLSGEIDEMADMCEGKDWATDDPLGIGGLLIAAYRIARLILSGGFTRYDLFGTVLRDSLSSLKYFEKRYQLNMAADERLAFREFGLSVGLQASRKLRGLLGEFPAVFRNPADRSRIEGVVTIYAPLSEQINTFWLREKNRESVIWKEHLNINMVMLATSLCPDGYLSAG